MSRGRAGRLRVDRGGDRPAGGVAGGRAWRAGTLSLQNIIQTILVLTAATALALLTEKPML